MAQKFLFLVKTGIFYEFLKWRKIEIRKQEDLLDLITALF